MLLAARWSDLVVNKVCFMKEAIEIKEREDITGIKLVRWKGRYKMGFVREETKITNTSRF
jgi:hypothetical protein